MIQPTLHSGNGSARVQAVNISPQSPTNSLAVISLVISLVSLSTGGITSVVAVICGHIARKQIMEDPNQLGSGMALYGLIIGYVGITIAVMLILLWCVIMFGLAAFSG
ncbi:MAG: DUF4190 domain-containing protein [Desulfobulbaceae bacterium]|nr:DUF4190 domain-containing protein [Desulfobulbaceae bacterium]